MFTGKRNIKLGSSELFFTIFQKLLRKLQKQPPKVLYNRFVDTGVMGKGSASLPSIFRRKFFFLRKIGVDEKSDKK